MFVLVLHVISKYRFIYFLLLIPPFLSPLSGFFILSICVFSFSFFFLGFLSYCISSVSSLSLYFFIPFFIPSSVLFFYPPHTSYLYFIHSFFLSFLFLLRSANALFRVASSNQIQLRYALLFPCFWLDLRRN